MSAPKTPRKTDVPKAGAPALETRRQVFERRAKAKKPTTTARNLVSRHRIVEPKSPVNTSLPPLPPPEKTLLLEIAAARWDIARFARLLGVSAHDGQRRFWDAILARDATLWRAAYLTLILSAGNRAGKTLAIAIAILHSCFYKTALKPLGEMPTDREAETWIKAPYDWFHFGIQQEVGELVYFELVNLLSGRHVAQKGRGCPLVEALGSQLAVWDVKERGEYRMVTLNPLLGGAVIHFRTTNEKALGSLGKDMHGISFDECGFETNLSFIINEVLHLRRLGTGGQLLLTSTPSEGFNEFAEEWRLGDPLNPLRVPDRMSLRMSTRDNIGYGIDQGMFDRLVRSMPEELIPQNIDGFFIEGRRAFFNAIAVDRSFHDGLPEVTPPQFGHRYVLGIDPASSKDETWAVVMDVTQPGRFVGVRAEKRGGKQSIPGLISMLKGLHDEYNTNGAQCSTALDATGFGGKVIRDLLSGVSPLRNVEFGGTTRKKLRILTDLKALVEQSRLTFPRTGIWLHLRRQLLAYRIDDKNLTTDAVMALVVAATEIVRNSGEAIDSMPFDMFDERDLSINAPEGQVRGRSYRPLGADEMPPPQPMEFDPVKRAQALAVARRLRRTDVASAEGLADW